MRLEYHRKQREIQNEQGAGVLSEGEKQGAGQEEAGRPEAVVEHVAVVGLHDNGSGGDLAAPPQAEDKEAEVRPVKKVRRKKG